MIVNDTSFDSKSHDLLCAAGNTFKGPNSGMLLKNRYSKIRLGNELYAALRIRVLGGLPNYHGP